MKQEEASDQEDHAARVQEQDDQLWLATLQEPQGPSPWTSMSLMEIEDPWIADLEKERAEADLMCWDFALPQYWTQFQVPSWNGSPKDTLESPKQVSSSWF